MIVDAVVYEILVETLCVGHTLPAGERVTHGAPLGVRPSAETHLVLPAIPSRTELQVVVLKRTVICM